MQGRRGYWENVQSNVLSIMITKHTANRALVYKQTKVKAGSNEKKRRKLWSRRVCVAV